MEGFERDQGEHDGSQTAGTEPAHEQEADRPQAGPDHRYGHRHHSDHAEAQHCIGNRHERHPIAQLWGEEQGSEDGPYQERSEQTEVLGELDRLVELPSRGHGKDDAADERSHEAVPPAATAPP